MLVFNLAISCLNTSIALINGPNISDSYAILLFITLDFASITSISTTGHPHPTPLGSVSSLFLQLFLHWSPVAYWAPTDLGSSFLSATYFLSFHTVHGVQGQEYWSDLPFPCPMGHILSKVSTMTHKSWVALHGMAHDFIELDKAVVHVIRLVSFLCLWFSVCLPSDGEG